jgi:hypothetical protein
MVSLYSADISDIAQPVKKEKKIRAKKNAPKIDDTPTTPEKEIDIGREPVSVPPKEKKPATEKQLAALAKAQETRKRKRDEKLAEDEAKRNAEKQAEDERIAAEEAKAVKKAEANERRKQARLAKKNTPPPSEVSDTTSHAIDDAVEELKTKKQVRPPAWFKQFVNNVKQGQEEAAPVKRAKTEVTKEVNQIANAKWQDGAVRDQVQNATSRHEANMYKMIFGK